MEAVPAFTGPAMTRCSKGHREMLNSNGEHCIMEHFPFFLKSIHCNNCSVVHSLLAREARKLAVLALEQNLVDVQSV